MPEFAQPLREENVDPDPVQQFATWFEQAANTDIRMPEAAALATASAAGEPSVRMVLVKQFDQQGFVFYSNYESRKATELAANPLGALLFYWDPLGRQVRIEGRVQHTSAEESAAYVRSRPHGSQLSALASPQSRVIASRAELEERVGRLSDAHGDGELPLPNTWGGFRLEPASYEFWQHREDRLHDRLLYTRTRGDGWQIDRLAP